MTWFDEVVQTVADGWIIGCLVVIALVAVGVGI